MQQAGAAMDIRPDINFAFAKCAGDKAYDPACNHVIRMVASSLSPADHALPPRCWNA